ncbi:hypothetical protein Corgl_1486 [Coriobacterium glomerans PW2]|uniref:Phospholipase C/D domain-containing protein n=1 Tax=Coriobacterium glomerans (strain ATCC 49209 / DSM 20642 / JCM 10262 / PW2) TaxID=700015 RepID=F2N8Y5_CORGP|nr:hypothetical protein [Coriobacterium glomerans]AEB07585.1 hypothetical protein Corgl_1486 [Coriobacterium glomerans PW2]
MPSWNIHIAQTERLLARGGAVARAVRAVDAFLFGNVVPDIFVGYMVPDIAHPIAYHETHLTDSEPIPRPREREFWDEYVVSQLVRARAEEGAGALDEVCPETSAAVRCETPPEARVELDLCLGAWTHLLADNLWNTEVRSFLFSHGGVPGEQFRIKKQGDFDWFGKTLQISAVPRATPALYAAAAAFPQYPIDHASVEATIAVMAEVVRANGGVAEHPPYLLLNDDFFEETLEKVLDETDRILASRLERTG